MIERLVAIALLVGFVFGVVYPMVRCIAQAKCWSHLNRNVLLQRAVERYKAIGP